MSIAYESEVLEKKFPADGLIYARRAEAMYREQWVNEAVELLNQGNKQHPQYITGYLVLGRILKETGKFIDATTALENALRIDQRCHAALHLLAEIATGLQAHGESARHLAILTALEPWDSDFRSAYQNAIGKSQGTASSTAFSPSTETATDFNISEVADFLPKEEFQEIVEVPSASAYAPKPDETFPLQSRREEHATAIVPQDEATVVTGADLENRLDALFGNEPSNLTETASEGTASIAIPAPIPEATAIYLPPQTISEDSGLVIGDGERVEGSDIEKRLDDLFNWDSDSKVDTHIATELDVKSETQATEKTGTETDAVEASSVLTAAAETSTTPITGDDVEKQLDDLFATSEESPSATQFASREIVSTQPDFASLDDRTLAMPAFPAAKKDVAEIPESVVETDDLKPYRETGLYELPANTSGSDTVVGDDISLRLDQLFGDETAETSVTSFVDSDPGTSETSALEAPIEVASDNVSGSDVESRLSEIFGDEDVGMKTEIRPQEDDVGNQTMQMTRSQLFGDEEKPEETETKPGDEPTGEHTVLTTVLPMEEESVEEESTAEAPNVATVTLAEIYFQQGLKEQALQIYRQLLEREPDNETVRKRVEEIEALKAEDDKNGSDSRSPRPGLKVPRRKK